ncbi:MAG: molybdenum cofactor biosynthesis protein MoaE [Deltaproteobacteria bacterium]|jgi:molybdopterin synthase catalytic subunit|nr:molybdenum cofactor biosynthesis protein MoaE [Deltaproteobacteria bacterium]MBT4525228.1 molybdenum cofactor biosynthesis protein MoaE [Deltaproteobacteria bacterium]
MFEIVNQKINTDAVIESVATPEAGAISTFIGVTRNFTGDLDVDYLNYEAYDDMAIKMMQKIGDMALEKYDIRKISIVHRIGKVKIKEASVVIAVSSSHRKPAIEACHYAIDTLKELVPIWKKEFLASGEQKWIANRSEVH